MNDARTSSDNAAQLPPELNAVIGQAVLFEGADSVTLNDIRRKLEVYCFSCPLHEDDVAARKSGYQGIVAPATMTPLWSLAPYWRAGEPSPFRPGTPQRDGNTLGFFKMPFTKAVNAGSEWEYSSPLYLGDRLRASLKMASVEAKRTRLGNGVFLHFETTYHKTSGELVALNRNTLFNFDPNEPGGKTDPGGQAVGGTRAEQDRPDPAETSIDWNRQLWFDEVAIGSEIPAYELNLTYQRIVMGTAADRMYSGVHHNREEARAAGLNDIIFNTRGIEAFLEISLRRWMGLLGRIRRLGPFSMRSNIHPGDTMRSRWKVTGVEPSASGGLVQLGFTVETERGSAVNGVASIELPARTR